MSSSHRPFRLIDALILIAGIAVGLVWARWSGLMFGGPPPNRVAYISHVNAFAIPIASVGLVLRRVGPRPKRAADEPPPGDLACVAICLSQLIGLAARGPFHLTKYLNGQTHYVLFPFDLWSYGQTAVAVLAAWGVLGLAGKWRAERDWVDRLGIGIGIYWVFACLVLNNVLTYHRTILG